MLQDPIKLKCYYTHTEVHQEGFKIIISERKWILIFKVSWMLKNKEYGDVVIDSCQDRIQQVAFLDIIFFEK